MEIPWQSILQKISCSQWVFPCIPALVNNGSWAVIMSRTGYRAGERYSNCDNPHYDSFLVIDYVKMHLMTMVDVKGKHEWRDHTEVPGVHQPWDYYFGASPITGHLLDNHNLISFKLFG
ncbi:VIP36-like protein [Galemys pyrenaicus]|uniref:VIP36-like protein n=1 Tax=Galemys pyrenaicus TaxID=202257 RepID=A0A8J6AHY9_GALPY|nr:VIP36-like protein [Galemys pyrenaicus]